MEDPMPTKKEMSSDEEMGHDKEMGIGHEPEAPALYSTGVGIIENDRKAAPLARALQGRHMQMIAIGQ